MILRQFCEGRSIEAGGNNLTLKQRCFPVHIGVFMFPLLLASVFVIIIFSMNILYINNESQAAANVLATPKKSNVKGTPNVNLSLTGSGKISNDKRKITSDKTDSALPNINVDVKEAKIQKALAVPVGGAGSNYAEVRKTDAASGVKPSRELRQNKPSNENNVKSVPPRAETQNWSVQAGAFSVESSAVSVKSKIEALGYNVKIVKTGTARPLFRIMVSSEESGITPNDVLKKLNSIGIDGYVISGRL